MTVSSDLRERLPGMLRALAIGVPAGFLFTWLETPIPWMIGPMIAIAVVNLMGMRVHSVPYGRQMGQVILGSAVSIYFTPTVVAALGNHFVPILLATLSAFVIGGLGALVMSRVSGIDRKSSFFASIPGGSMAMAVLAQRYGAQIPPVAVTHSLRVSIVVVAIPFALTYGGIPLEASAYTPQLPFNIWILIPWLACGFLIGGVSEKLNFHNGYMMMPIFLGAGLTISGVELSSVPGWMTDFAQLMFGLILGERYERAFFARHKMFIPFALINALFIVLASVAVALGLAWAFGISLATMIIATAPGGLAEMTIVAQALEIGVPTVVAFHLFRIVIVNMGTQHIFTLGTWMIRRVRGTAADKSA
ncbi:MAG: AbrB family transcriptional regulator [Rhodospirillaceae bacterium]|nr:AbrB family transcriptional regulator [Rhodospirillaceae bacterium]MBT5458015.1 AbrB family transcriptional regulator [Rhodospirillaceae bacterium]